MSTLQRKPRSRRLDLGTSQGIADAAALQRKLTNMLSRKSPILVNGKELQRLDTAAIQVLAAFWMDAAARGVDVEWAQLSDAARDCIALVGMSEALGVESV